MPRRSEARARVRSSVAIWRRGARIADHQFGGGRVLGHRPTSIARSAAGRTGRQANREGHATESMPAGRRVGTSSAASRSPPASLPMYNGAGVMSECPSRHPASRSATTNMVQKLGAGGMGEVYEANDASLDRQVALKTLPAELAAHPERRARLSREAKTLAALEPSKHRDGVPGSKSRGIHFITMELVKGKTLAGTESRRRGSIFRGSSPWRSR